MGLHPLDGLVSSGVFQRLCGTIGVGLSLLRDVGLNPVGLPLVILRVHILWEMALLLGMHYLARIVGEVHGDADMQLPADDLLFHFGHVGFHVSAP
jgi:hypothetical protein